MVQREIKQTFISAKVYKKGMGWLWSAGAYIFNEISSKGCNKDFCIRQLKISRKIIERTVAVLFFTFHPNHLGKYRMHVRNAKNMKCS